MAKKTTMSAEERKAARNARARQRRAEKTGRAIPVTYDPAVALAEATTVAAAVMAQRDLEAEQTLAAAIDATTPPDVPAPAPDARPGRRGAWARGAVVRRLLLNQQRRGGQISDAGIEHVAQLAREAFHRAAAQLD